MGLFEGDHLVFWLDHSAGSQSETSTSLLVLVMALSISFEPSTEYGVCTKISLISAQVSLVGITCIAAAYLGHQVFGLLGYIVLKRYKN